ncbi:hypothetical protein FRC98_13015 [Lujinxingia vulgaris]|uniref:Uncharacterized protein n=1 Tax=Lujinxingia vulgaris TaxID=2600176 RepID=A0A5C6XH18_9DELT|nr:hypothetical protein [Lujinxingia vulgaris]TXD36741.1 hypothetical protein FRC98_13015 [Lujinxingia vulgaris]
MLQPSRIWGERLEPVKVPKDGEDIGFDMTIHNAVVDHRLARLILEFRDGAQTSLDLHFAGEFARLPDLWSEEEG